LDVSRLDAGVVETHMATIFVASVLERIVVGCRQRTGVVRVAVLDWSRGRLGNEAGGTRGERAARV
jgi:hypothetical protein